MSLPTNEYEILEITIKHLTEILKDKYDILTPDNVVKIHEVMTQLGVKTAVNTIESLLPRLVTIENHHSVYKLASDFEGHKTSIEQISCRQACVNWFEFNKNDAIIRLPKIIQDYISFRKKSFGFSKQQADDLKETVLEYLDENTVGCKVVILKIEEASCDEDWMSERIGGVYVHDVGDTEGLRHMHDSISILSIKIVLFLAILVKNMKNGSKTAKIEDFISIFMLLCNGGDFFMLMRRPPLYGNF